MERETQKPDSQNQTLPDDLIFEHILPKLPLKSLTRFKSVSKLWLSTISSPKFTKSQFLLFSGNRDPHPLFTSVTLDQHGGVEQILKFNYNCNGKRIHVLGSCNGLVCFCDEYFNFYICNPVTEKCNDINRPENAPDFTPNKIIAAGFGYVSSIDDYKIVCLIGKSTRYFSLALSNVYLFSLRNRNWERALSRLNVYGLEIAPVDRVPALVNDALYWYASNINHIVEVNLINAEVRSFAVTIAGMLNTSLQSGDRVRLYGIQGRLCLRCGREVWSLNKDGLTWMKMNDLNFTGMGLLCVSEAGKWLVLNQKLLALLDSNKSFYRQYQGGTSFDGPIFSAWDYKMSSVSPFLE